MASKGMIKKRKAVNALGRARIKVLKITGLIRYNIWIWWRDVEWVDARAKGLLARGVVR